MADDTKKPVPESPEKAEAQETPEPRKGTEAERGEGEPAPQGGTRAAEGGGGKGTEPTAPKPPAAAKPAPPPSHQPPGNPVMVAPPAERAAAQKRAAAPPASAPGVEERVSRRGFFSWAAVAWVGFAAAIGGCVTAFGRFMFPNVLFEPPTQFKVGPPDDFPPGVVDARFKESNGVWIVHLKEEGKVVAIIAICTHLGCPPNWLDAQNKFKCPCHGSGYYKDGINFEGPTPRPLERAKVTIDADDGQIVVDKAQTYQWELGEWSDPDSYIELA